MFGKKSEPAPAARAPRQTLIEEIGVAYRSSAAAAQGRCRGQFVARTKVRDAAYCPPLPRDEVWFLRHPGRRHRLRALHPTDADRLAGRVGDWRADRLDLMLIIRDIGDSMLAVRLAASDLPLTDDEALLAALFDGLVARHPGLAALQQKLEARS
jgi:hypothetical protein